MGQLAFETVVYGAIMVRRAGEALVWAMASRVAFGMGLACAGFTALCNSWPRPEVPEPGGATDGTGY